MFLETATGKFSDKGLKSNYSLISTENSTLVPAMGK